MKNYVVMEFIPYEGWVFDSVHETKADAENRITERLSLGVGVKHIKLFSDLSWKAKSLDGKVSYKRGNWDGATY